MNFLPPDNLNSLGNAIMQSVGYSHAIRRIFFRDVNQHFKDLLMGDPTERVQLDLDLMELNKDQPLTDGTIPFLAWLQQAGAYVQHIGSAYTLVQKAIARIESRLTNAAPPKNPAPPSQLVVNNIIKEKIIHSNDMLSYAFLELGWKAGISVARILVPRFEQGVKKMNQVGSPVISAGTGWLLTKELLITNHHVINAREEGEPDADQPDFLLQAGESVAEFDYNADSQLGTLAPVAKLEAGNQELDYAILRLKTPVNRIPSPRFPQQIHITQNNPQAINIIQHPFGYSKKVAIRNNHIFDSDYPRIRYFTDTDKGSSGSPVFNDTWQAIALHRASNLVEGVVFQGKSIGWVNEGIQLKAIFDHLKTNFPAIDAEILNN